MSSSAKPFVSISIITPKPEQFDAFMELQLAQFQRVRGQVQGLQGSRLFRSNDNRSVVLVSVFETSRGRPALPAGSRLTDHLARAQPLIESATPGVYETA